MENSETAPEQETTPGQRLRDAREAAGMSAREMADRLNWLPAHVGAIEADSFDELRSAAFVRGYLRAYARAVSLDEDEIVALYAVMRPETAEHAPRSASPPPTSSPSQKTGMSVVLGVTVAVAVIAAIWWQQQRPEQEPTAAPKAAQAASADAGAGLSASQADTPIDPAPETASSVAATTPVTFAGDEGNADKVSASEPGPTAANEVASPAASSTPTATIEPQPAQSEAAATPSQPAAGSAPAADNAAIDADGALQFSFSGDCWLEVRDGEGQLIYADLRSAGDTLGLDGVPPFEILAGDAAAVTLRYRGEPVVMQTRPGRDTARLTVGEP